MQYHTISFCTVSMNRLNHLKYTLPENISGNKSYKNVEFVVVDYNSSDGLESFIQENMQAEIEAGLLVYYRTLTPQHFSRSHSRNLAFKLAKGDIICNVDADNYTGRNFASFINSKYQKKQNKFLTTFNNKHVQLTDVLGRICLTKDDFYEIGGYDERMGSYGFEDYDFVNRLRLNKLTMGKIPHNRGFLNAISHETKSRIENEYLLKNLELLLVNYISPANTEFLFLLKDRSFRLFSLLDTESFDMIYLTREFESSHPLKLDEANCFNGKYNLPDNELLLLYNSGHVSPMASKANGYYEPQKNVFFYTISDSHLIEKIVLCISELSNRAIYEKNNLTKNLTVNGDGFGRDVVYKNFDYSAPIIVK